MKEPLEALEARVRRLEQCNRWMSLACVTAIGAALLLAATRPAVTQADGYEVRAPFRVLNDAGRVVFEVGSVRRPAFSNGTLDGLTPPPNRPNVPETRLTVNDPTGKPRVVVGAAFDRASLGVTGPDLRASSVKRPALIVTADPRRVEVVDHTGATLLSRPEPPTRQRGE